MKLTPNTQITQENVGLLKAGFWLRCTHWHGEFFTAGQDYEVLGVEDGAPVLTNNLSERDPVYLFNQFSFVRPALSPPAEGEVDAEAFDRMIATCENPPPASEELKARLRDARRLINPTPAPVDWTLVGPKLVEALEAAIPTLESDYGEAQDCADEAWIERAWQRLKTARNALTIAQTESKA